MGDCGPVAKVLVAKVRQPAEHAHLFQRGAKVAVAARCFLARQVIGRRVVGGFFCRLAGCIPFQQRRSGMNQRAADLVLAPAVSVGGAIVTWMPKGKIMEGRVATVPIYSNVTPGCWRTRTSA